ncbi:M23 family metallopeptidase [Brumimicrobium mesophilum]|uniref:M23 family metallopeptidase n=1 Tax=Brumimicrobium mesophilum TaxID=392717 RepID=UPI000D140F05|nr:M23 family metallopeptidase [Brumimicrobium mesophilum]
MKYLFFVTVLFAMVKPLSSQTVRDTIDSPNGKILMYDNHTWEYLEDLAFDGVLNDFVHEYFLKDSLIDYKWPWDSESCYSSNRTNDLSLLKDTLWLCVTDSTNSEFVMPFDGKVTSRYGYRRGRYHNGIDINLNTGDPVVAAFDGKVRYSKYNSSGFGNLVIIRHYNGLETFYAHLSELNVVPNQFVKAGDLIGLGGNTGNSYGSHLHFEMRFYDAPMNPEEVIDFKTKKVRDQNLFVHNGLFRPGAAPSHSPLATTTSHTAVASSAIASNAVYYRVKGGDTLGHIARKNHTTVSRLCKLNNIRSTTTLKIGRRLRVK